MHKLCCMGCFFSIFLLVVVSYYFWVKLFWKLLNKTILLKINAFCDTKCKFFYFLKMTPILLFILSTMSESTSEGSIQLSQFCVLPFLQTQPHSSPWVSKHLQALWWLLLVRVINYSLSWCNMSPGAILRHTP